MSAGGTGFHQELPLAINRANQAILDHAGEYPECRGMGTTIAILHLEGNRARVAHIGTAGSTGGTGKTAPGNQGPFGGRGIVAPRGITRRRPIIIRNGIS